MNDSETSTSPNENAESRRWRYGGYLAFDASLTVSPAIMK
jgi:hypothetical protein